MDVSRKSFDTQIAACGSQAEELKTCTLSLHNTLASALLAYQPINLNVSRAIHESWIEWHPVISQLSFTVN